MSEGKLIPGPWRVRDEDGPPVYDVLGPDGRLLIHVWPRRYLGAYPPADQIMQAYADAEATARVVACLPGLIRVLKLIATNRIDGELTPAANLARGALMAATIKIEEVERRMPMPEPMTLRERVARAMWALCKDSDRCEWEDAPAEDRELLFDACDAGLSVVAQWLREQYPAYPTLRAACLKLADEIEGK